MSRKKLTIGIQAFREIREDNCYYVDKTAFTLRMVREGKAYFLVSSPCRLKRLDFLLFDQPGWIVRYPLGTAMIPWRSQERPAGFSP